MSMSGDDTPNSSRSGEVSSPSGMGANEAGDPTRSGESHSGRAGSADRLSGEAQATAQRAADQVKEDTAGLTEEAKRLAQDTAEKQKSAAAEQISRVAAALHSAAHELDQGDGTGFGRYADQAAGSLDRLSERIRNKDVRSILGDVEDFARNQPVLFITGAVAIGFALGRFFRASSHEAYERDYRHDGGRAPRYRPDYGPEAASPGGFVAAETTPAADVGTSG